MQDIKTIEEIFDVIESIGDDFPSNVKLELSFRNIGPLDDLQKFARQEGRKLITPTKEIPFYWFWFCPNENLTVTIKSFSHEVLG